MGDDRAEPKRDRPEDDTKTPRRPERESAPMPPAGPHARPGLINPQAKPGAGTLPPDEADGEESDPGAG